MTVAELITALRECDGALVVALAQSRPAPVGRRTFRDVRDARAAVTEVLGEIRLLNGSIYADRGIGDPVTRLVISADE